ncbi:hypothetical protein GS889_14290 [Rhodococcus hoagii]|nr:hypothetical protein [Prescottella equi]
MPGRREHGKEGVSHDLTALRHTSSSQADLTRGAPVVRQCRRDVPQQRRYSPPNIAAARVEVTVEVLRDLTEEGCVGVERALMRDARHIHNDLAALVSAAATCAATEA